MVVCRLTEAKLDHGEVGVMVLGLSMWQGAVNAEPSYVFKHAVTNSVKRTDKDRKCKASAAAMLQCKKAWYSIATVNNSWSSRMAYSRYENHHALLSLHTHIYNNRHGGGAEAQDLP